MDFLEDLSSRLVEWLEANYLFGAQKIVLYNYKVHENMQRVLDFYAKTRWEGEAEKRFEAVRISLPGAHYSVAVSGAQRSL